ncbi:uncharacterized protein LOC141629890 [Silene latifolia]|uniref:uncharacterized protein LOC141629890 n=1 Tax=Silene latifolia TaxID=37657 RepID=UPI003D76E202
MVRLSDHSKPTAAMLPRGIVTTQIGAADFEIKPDFISLDERKQFSGSPMKDPNLHVQIFCNYCSMIRQPGVTQAQIREILFPFSLRGKAKLWINSLDRATMEITDWDSLALAFYQKYFPLEKTQQLRSQITGFRQNGYESLFDAWERYKELQRECPHHGLDPWFLAITFYNGCCAESRRVLDSANNGRFDQIDTELAHSTIESMAVHDSQYVNSRNTSLKDKEEDTTISLLKAQVALLQQQMDNRGTSSSQSHEQVNVTSQVMVCEACGGAGHGTALCRASIEEVNAFQSFRQNLSPISNTYNEATKYHPNLS